MIAAYKTVDAFRGYLTVLGELERMFQFAGEKIEFRLGLRGDMRYVEILREGKPVNVTFIKGHSPARALQDVAVAVPL
jgi:hypothetical protein